jgi:hypothetical protein
MFVSDALPTDPALGPESFDQSTVALLPPSSEVSSSSLTSFTITAVPEPSSLWVLGPVVPLVAARRAPRPASNWKGSGRPARCPSVGGEVA